MLSGRVLFIFLIRIIIVFPTNVEYSYFSADFKLKTLFLIFLDYSISYEISAFECI